jgi:hypothetical protein
VSFTIHYIRCSSCTHPTFIRCSSDIHPFCILVSMSRVCPVYIRHSSGTHSFLSSSVQSYLRSNLTADSRTSPVPAILHFVIHSYYFHLSMFERFINCIVSFLLCVFYDTILMHAHPGVYPAVFPVYIRRAPGTHSVLHLRSNLTFGHILPRILEQVLCPRYSISRSSRYYTFSLLFFFFPNIT